MRRPPTLGFGRAVSDGPDGTITWSTGRYQWRYCQRDDCQNLEAALGGGPWVPVVYLASCRDAAMFAEGFELGVVGGLGG